MSRKLIYSLIFIIIVSAVLYKIMVNMNRNYNTISVQTPAPVQPIVDKHADLIKLYSPQANNTIQSPLVIKGEARGNWYFEASFPVKLKDANGNVIASAPAQAQGNWMTMDFVPFQLTLTYATPATPTGTLVLEKDNPSGDPAKDDSISIPVKFQ